jgi:hypothetical protein
VFVPCVRSFKKVGWTMGLEPHSGDSPTCTRLPTLLLVTDRDHIKSIPVVVASRVSIQAATKKWGGRWDSNPRRPGSQPGALPTELRPPRYNYSNQSSRQNGAPGRTRTCNPRLSLPTTALTASAIAEFVVWTISSPSQAPHV